MSADVLSWPKCMGALLQCVGCFVCRLADTRLRVIEGKSKISFSFSGSHECYRVTMRQTLRLGLYLLLGNCL